MVGRVSPCAPFRHGIARVRDVVHRGVHWSALRSQDFSWLSFSPSRLSKVASTFGT